MRWSRHTASKCRWSRAHTDAAASSNYVCCWCGPSGLSYIDTASWSAVQSTVIFIIVFCDIALARRCTRNGEEDARHQAYAAQGTGHRGL